MVVGRTAGRASVGRDGGEGDGEGQPCWVWWALTLCVVEAVGEFPAER